MDVYHSSYYNTSFSDIAMLTEGFDFNLCPHNAYNNGVDNSDRMIQVNIDDAMAKDWCYDVLGRTISNYFQ